MSHVWRAYKCIKWSVSLHGDMAAETMDKYCSHVPFTNTSKEMPFGLSKRNATLTYFHKHINQSTIFSVKTFQIPIRLNHNVACETIKPYFVLNEHRNSLHKTFKPNFLQVRCINAFLLSVFFCIWLQGYVGCCGEQLWTMVSLERCCSLHLPIEVHFNVVFSHNPLQQFYIRGKRKKYTFRTHALFLPIH